jgi:hypothetical protein
MRSASSVIKIVVAFSILWASTLTCAVVVFSNRDPVEPPQPRTLSAVEVRLATKVCHHQFNNQTDVQACLARYLGR